jgi:hypothetical protein
LYTRKVKVKRLFISKTRLIRRQTYQAKNQNLKTTTSNKNTGTQKNSLI